jgi:RNA polymerase sigma-70 factor (ECF subfamily)
MTLLVEDRGLLAKFREGQRDAMERVYRHYVNDVAKFLRGSFGLRAPLELEAAVQDVFIRAFTPAARASYDGLRPYRGFLFGVARNVALAAREKMIAAGRVVPLPQDDDQLLEAVDESPEERLDRDKGRELVSAFLAAECDDHDRRLFALRWDEGMSQEQAARTAKLTRIQVRRWETKFRARLLRHLKRARFIDPEGAS